ncbi:Protocadherin-20 [Oryzias melastigma]|nr:Protocadherin-20 [Oryzias melastigma]
MVHLKQIVCGSIQLSIPEELEPGILVGSLGEHFPPLYQLLTQEYLRMDSNMGNIYTTGHKLDREALCPKETIPGDCSVVHNALVGPTEDLIQFLVIIEDINDNAPLFEMSEIHLRVSEDVTVGTSFFVDDQARDEDVGINGELQYHLEGSDGVFTLKVENRLVIELVVEKALDREIQELYHMQLVATDCGTPPLSSSAALMVTVTDVDDNCPSFSSDSTLTVTIPGDSLENTLVTQVTATDPDLASNAAIVYSFSPKVSERVKEIFSLDSHTGHIRLTQNLHSDKPEEVGLIVLASGPHCPPSGTQVTVFILPKANQELSIKIGLIAEHHNQTMVLPENQPPTVLAVLELQGDSGFKGSSLAIEGDVPFSLSPQNGKYLLSTSKPLDYEMKDEYSISVVAHVRSADGPLILPSRQTIRLLVVDVNDNAPHFSQSQYQLEVEENNIPGMSLLQVSATDADGGRNGKVTYRLDDSTSVIFNIHSTAGQLSVRAPLDREQQSVHKLTVFAQDGGSPPLESQATICIHVLDQNDNAPGFLSTHFIFFIRENSSPFTQVGEVEVKDPDEGENGSVSLHVVNSSGLFSIDKSQKIHTTTKLDREVEDHHEFYLVARDNGHPVALASTARVTVFVEDINDNPPKVILPNSNSSCLTVSPSTLAGTVLTKIYAIDEDSGLNSEITFAVVAPESAQNRSPFQIHPRLGTITLSQQLVPKDVGMHHLFIVVRDSGKPTPLYTTVWVNLLVNESISDCYLDKVPTWKGASDLLLSPSKAPICDVETTRSARVILFIGLTMILTSVSLLLVTACLYLKHRSLQKNKRGCASENEIPLRLRDKYYSDE